MLKKVEGTGSEREPGWSEHREGERVKQRSGSATRGATRAENYNKAGDCDEARVGLGVSPFDQAPALFTNLNSHTAGLIHSMPILCVVHSARGP